MTLTLGWPLVISKVLLPQAVVEVKAEAEAEVEAEAQAEVEAEVEALSDLSAAS